MNLRHLSGWADHDLTDLALRPGRDGALILVCCTCGAEAVGTVKVTIDPEATPRLRVEVEAAKKKKPEAE